jgi:hypothetical protein
MAEIINLNQFRKKRLKSQAQRKAAHNRARHGRSGAEKATTKAEVRKHERELSAKKCEHPDDGAPE